MGLGKKKTDLEKGVTLLSREKRLDSLSPSRIYSRDSKGFCNRRWDSDVGQKGLMRHQRKGGGAIQGEGSAYIL